jgi:mRNA-degrading endonuclease RelE of RelBE toxin-antitoxin system
MTYELIFDDQPIDFLSRLPKAKRKQVFEAIIRTETDPHRFFKHLRGRTDNSFTIGNIRVIADIAERKRRIEVTLIEYRSRAY